MKTTPKLEKRHHNCKIDKKNLPPKRKTIFKTTELLNDNNYLKRLRTIPNVSKKRHVDIIKKTTNSGV